MTLPVPVSLPGIVLAIMLMIGLSGCANQRPPFPTTPNQAEALDRVIAAVRVDLVEYRAGHSRLDLATVEDFLGEKDLFIRLILNDEQWSGYLAEQKVWWARSLQNELRREPPPGLLSVGPATREAPES